MGYIDILIPLIIGLLVLLAPDVLLKRADVAYEKKKSQLRIVGYILLAVATLYFILKMM